MAFETFHPETPCYHGVINPSQIPDWNEMASWFQFWCFMAINLGWFGEIWIQIIKDGFIANETAYLKNFPNFLDFCSVSFHFIDLLMKFPYLYQANFLYILFCLIHFSYSILDILEF